MTTPRKTNGQVAAKFNISARTVSRMRGRSRAAYLAECHDLRKKAAALHDTGMTWAQVAAALGVTVGAARAAAKRGIGSWLDGQQPERDERQQDLPL
jgi:hypothetical protein